MAWPRTSDHTGLWSFHVWIWCVGLGWCMGSHDMTHCTHGPTLHADPEHRIWTLHWLHSTPPACGGREVEHRCLKVSGPDPIPHIICLSGPRYYSTLTKILGNKQLVQKVHGSSCTSVHFSDLVLAEVTARYLDMHALLSVT